MHWRGRDLQEISPGTKVLVNSISFFSPTLDSQTLAKASANTLQLSYKYWVPLPHISLQTHPIQPHSLAAIPPKCLLLGLTLKSALAGSSTPPKVIPTLEREVHDSTHLHAYISSC